MGDEDIKFVLRERRTHRVLASSSLSIVFCLRSSSIRVVVTSFSFSVDSLVAIGGVTPRNLLQDRCLWYCSGQCIVMLTLDCCPFVVQSMQVMSRKTFAWAINLLSEGNSNRGEKVADKRVM